MLGNKPILKFTRIQDDADAPMEVFDMELSEFTWPKGGKGTCPKCGSPVEGIGKEWTCQNEECGLKLHGPIF